MFTGIVEELGRVVAVEDHGESARLRLRGPRVTADAGHGDSIAVNGVCLTVVETGDGEFTADVMAETLNRSSLGALTVGSPVNLERPMALGGRLDGHLVQGHVDGTGTITARRDADSGTELTVALPDGLGRYLVEKGSITVDGVSLTVVEAADDRFTVSLIPTTLALTTLGTKQPGDPVNLEVDVLAKYVERLLKAGASPARAAGETATPYGGAQREEHGGTQRKEEIR
ncbi:MULTISPECIES: riboflavin synthase [Streptomyces]|uniref:riboflavin synthase n=1 Tax=Streptomyces TaxID=1883 RepID=UPI0006B6526A|nr:MULTISPECIES: riboflavin synthase [Streptomyces]KPC93381.1 riboflavin synthase subunit alpha [Streptomyces sp. NRRL F-6602]QID35250.1 riboflavin synthase [Streptomyces albus]